MSSTVKAVEGDKMKNTDWGKLHTIFKELGIEHEVGQLDNKAYFILLGEGEGYNDFWCEFDFNKDGKFESHSVCEG